MRRARIKALANIPATRRPAKVIEKEPDGKKVEDNINIDEQGKNVQIKDVKIECNLKQIKDVQIRTSEGSKSCNENENLKSGKVNIVSVKPEREETSVSESQFPNTLESPVKVDKGSCQDESILPNQENSEKSHMCVSSPIELCEVNFSHDGFLQCNEMGSIAEHSLLPKTKEDTSSNNVAKKFKVGLNGELVVDETENLQKTIFSCENESNQKSVDNERIIKKPIIIDDTLYSNGLAQKITHSYANHADGSKILIRNETLSRKKLSNILKPSLVKVDKGSCQDESILPYHENRETVPHKLMPSANVSTIEQTQEQNFVPPNNNRVTIHDVIHTKLYARLPKQICSVCNGVGCTAEHKVLPRIECVPEEDAIQRVKVGPNGQLVIDEGEHFSENRRFSVESSEVPTFSDMSSYRKRTMGGWNSESTSKFLKALRVFGTDFDMMKSWFPEKSRYQLYRKFKKEEKCNGAVVDDLLRNQNFDADAVQEGIEFSRQTKTRNSETTNFQNQKERGKKKSKKRKIRGLVLKSIEMSSTDEEIESDSTIDEMKMIQKTITIHDTLCGNIGSHQTTQNSNVNRTNGLDKLRYEEMSNILKEMKSKQEERVRLKKTQRSKPD